MFDMRYHIASLVAVFLALTVGLLLGSLIVDKGILANQQEGMLKSIQVDIEKINEQNNLLRQKLDQLERFQSQALPIAVKDRLLDKQVVIATFSPEQNKLQDEIERGMELGGAETFSLRIDTEKLDFSNEELVTQLGATFNETEAVGGSFERRFWDRFASEIAGVESPVLTDELVGSGLVSFDTSAIPVKNIVIVAATKKQARNRDMLFLEAIAQEEEIRVVGVEQTTTKPSRVSAYKLRKVSTVDNVDEVAGIISLSYLLSNPEVNAHYGVKSTAGKFMP